MMRSLRNSLSACDTTAHPVDREAHNTAAPRRQSLGFNTGTAPVKPRAKASGAWRLVHGRVTLDCLQKRRTTTEPNICGFEKTVLVI